MAQKVKNPATGESYNLSDPTGLVKTVGGGIVAMTIFLWSLMFASNQGVPLMNSVLSMVPGVDLTSDNSDSGNGLLGEL